MTTPLSIPLSISHASQNFHAWVMDISSNTCSSCLIFAILLNHFPLRNHQIPSIGHPYPLHWIPLTETSQSLVSLPPHTHASASGSRMISDVWIMDILTKTCCSCLISAILLNRCVANIAGNHISLPFHSRFSLPHIRIEKELSRLSHENLLLLFNLPDPPQSPPVQLPQNTLP